MNRSDPQVLGSVDSIQFDDMDSTDGFSFPFFLPRRMIAFCITDSPSLCWPLARTLISKNDCDILYSC